jgi:hypothetical protein
LRAALFHDKLEIINDHSCKITINSCVFPKSLTKIIHIIDKNNQYVEYQKQIGLHTKMAILSH